MHSNGQPDKLTFRSLTNCRPLSSWCLLVIERINISMLTVKLDYDQASVKITIKATEKILAYSPGYIWIRLVLIEPYTDTTTIFSYDFSYGVLGDRGKQTLSTYRHLILLTYCFTRISNCLSIFWQHGYICHDP